MASVPLSSGQVLLEGPLLLSYPTPTRTLVLRSTRFRRRLPNRKCGGRRISSSRFSSATLSLRLACLKKPKKRKGKNHHWEGREVRRGYAERLRLTCCLQEGQHHPGFRQAQRWPPTAHRPSVCSPFQGRDLDSTLADSVTPGKLPSDRLFPFASQIRSPRIDD